MKKPSKWFLGRRMRDAEELGDGSLVSDFDAINRHYVVGGRSRRRDFTKASRVVLLSLVFMGAIFFLNMKASDVPDLDENLCPRPSLVKGHTVVLIDRTDKLSIENRSFLISLFSDIKDDLMEYERLSIYPINSDSGRVPQSLFTLCAPPSGEDANFLYQTPKYLDENFNERFGEPLSRIIRGFDIDLESKTSPIIETIQALGTFDIFAGNLERKKIIIFSDLLQNSEILDQIRRPADIELSAIDRVPILKLDDVEVTVYYLSNARIYGQQQGNHHRQFWEALFEISGANYVSFKSVDEYIAR